MEMRVSGTQDTLPAKLRFQQLLELREFLVGKANLFFESVFGNRWRLGECQRKFAGTASMTRPEAELYQEKSVKLM